MSGRLQDKVAIVTGGGMGFGKSIVEKYLKEGAKVVIVDFNEEVGSTTAKELGCAFSKANVTLKADWESVLKLTLDTYGALDIVINNAGTTYKNKPTEQVTDEDFDKVFAVNVKSIYLSTVVCLPYFLEKGRPGNFINIASTAGVRPRPNLTWYNSSKAAVNCATKSMAVEYGPKKIRFNSICPVIATGTGLTSLFLGKEDNEENMKAFYSVVPLGRGCTGPDVANACAYLGSDEAEFITGVALEVDGGRCV
ncbi:hypothetical protein R6Q59_009984 [Mikania micrantha]